MREFSQWFAVRLSGTVAPGVTLSGQITVPGFEHVRCEVTVETVQPEPRFSFRWHPYEIDANVDYSGEPKTLVLFTLEEVAGGTQQLGNIKRYLTTR